MSGDLETIDSASAPEDLTVLMPIFRQEAYVVSAVTSVLNQRDIVLDVIISDDASGDQTLEQAVSAVQACRPHPHTVRVRRGEARLGRAHIHELVPEAKTALVAQAHGDDVAMPGRFRQIADVVAREDAVFVTSGFSLIDAEGAPAEEWAGTGGTRQITLAEAIDRPPWSMGAMEAWVPAAFADFAALDLEFAPVSHDRIMAARSAMLGRGWLIDAPLIHRRSHAAAWNRRLVDGGSPEARKHGWALVTLLWAGVILDDARTAAIAKIVDPSEIADELATVRRLRDSALRELRRQHGKQLKKTKRLKWVGDL